MANDSGVRLRRAAGVITTDGATLLHRTFCLPYAGATYLVKAISAPFDVPYATRNGLPICPDTDDVLMTEPPPRSSIDGMPYLQPNITPRTLTAMVLSHTSTSMVMTSPSRPSTSRPRAPALLNRMSTPPKVRVAAAIISRTSASTLTSAPTARARRAPPPSLRASATSCAPGSLMSAITTLAPSDTIRSTVAFPIPDAAPVPTATLPVSRSAPPTCAPSVAGRSVWQRDPGGGRNGSHLPFADDSRRARRQCITQDRSHGWSVLLRRAD